jgi:peptidoglycan/LPS O-acetylase OafA/YrhL
LEDDSFAGMIQKPNSSSSSWYTLWKRYRLALIIDGLFGLMMFLMFNIHGGFIENRHSTIYSFYDRFCFLYGFPVLFCGILILSLLQPKYPRAIITTVLAEGRITTLLGEVSYALYLLQQIFLDFWVAYGYEGIKQGKWPYTRAFIYSVEENASYSDYKSWYVRLVGCILVFFLAIFVQKIIQERVMTFMFTKVRQWNWNGMAFSAARRMRR